ncbi:PRC and DUF2382 domain-containing protein [Streptacidiphilus sp. EB129]|uniref:PRC and DUF2382 domain-containing protein n=1 Tax=Streptacidiphilus sp. EB129 TaxID=3156262 RepID=UPI0035184D97
MQTEIDPRDLIGHKAVDRNGDKIGTVDEVYLDDATGQPEWAAVRTGLFGRDAFVPLATSEFISDELRVPYEKSQVKDSPDFGAGQHLSPAQELQLYRYYGLEVPTGGQDSGAGSAGGAAGDAAKAAAKADPASTSTTGTVSTPVVSASGAGMAAPVAATVAATTVPSRAEAPPRHDTAGTARADAARMEAPRTDAPRMDTSRTAAFTAAPPAAPPQSPAATTASTPVAKPDPLTDPLPGSAAPSLAKGGAAPLASRTAEQQANVGVPEPVEFVCREERLDISTEWRVLGRARLRKYVTTEQVERRVPVIRERIRVERVPVGAEERVQLSDQEIAESSEEVTLHEQRVVVRKAIVPVERIRLVTERFTEEEVVRDELHREHIQVQDSTRPTGPTPVPGSGQPMAPPYTPPARPEDPDHAIGA